MIRKMSCVSVMLLFFFIIGGCGKTYTGPPADLVIKNAKVVTIDKSNPRAEAVAVSAGKIIGITSNKAIDQYIDEGFTKVIDAEGRLVIPGFNDAHCHYRAQDPNFVWVRYIDDPAIITQRVKEKVANLRPGELIRGRGWDHERFPGQKWPTTAILDPVSPNNPVAINRMDGHSVLVNSYVLKHSGITKDTPDPFGGEIVKDPVTGEPTGIFKESAKRLLNYGAIEVKRTPEEEEARLMRNWQNAFEEAASLGVTSIQHAGGGPDEIYQKFLDMGKLPLRVYLTRRLPADPERFGEYDRLRDQYPLSGDWIRFGYLKGFIDGTIGSGTMLVFKPFEDEPDKTGLPQMPYDELERRIVMADEHGYQIGIHAIGPKANYWVLNAYETAQQVNGIRDSRHRSEHAQILRLEDIPRFAELGVIASMQPTHCITDKLFAEKRIGKERSKGAYAWRRLLNAGVHIAFGTDYIVEPLDPLDGLYAGVTRKFREGESGPGWFPDQILTMEETIELYTLGSAYAEFIEDRKGMIKEGYLADMVIMNNDLMTMPHDQIMKSKVDYTIVGGKVVYQREGAQ